MLHTLRTTIGYISLKSLNFVTKWHPTRIPNICANNLTSRQARLVLLCDNGFPRLDGHNNKGGK